MKTTVSAHTFREAFRNAGRQDNFSYSGLGLLFEYLEQYESDCGTEIELDVVAICCDYYSDNVESIASDYDIDLTECEDDEERFKAVIDYLQDNTDYIGQDDEGNLIYQVF